MAFGHAVDDIGKTGFRIEAVELGGLCREPNYAEWSGT